MTIHEPLLTLLALTGLTLCVVAAVRLTIFVQPTQLQRLLLHLPHGCKIKHGARTVRARVAGLVGALVMAYVIGLLQGLIH